MCLSLVPWSEGTTATSIDRCIFFLTAYAKLGFLGLRFIFFLTPDKAH